MPRTSRMTSSELVCCCLWTFQAAMTPRPSRNTPSPMVGAAIFQTTRPGMIEKTLGYREVFIKVIASFVARNAMRPMAPAMTRFCPEAWPTTCLAPPADLRPDFRDHRRNRVSAHWRRLHDDRRTSGRPGAGRDGHHDHDGGRRRRRPPWKRIRLPARSHFHGWLRAGRLEPTED